MKAIQSNKQFNELVKSNKPLVLDFYADWCGPCQQLLPTVTKLAEEYKEDVNIVKVNIEDQRDLAAKFKVRSIPALFFLDGNKIKDKHQGLASEATLRKKIGKLI